MRADVLRRAAIVGTTEVYTNQRETAERKKTERRIKTKKNLQINRLYKIEFSWSFFRGLALCYTTLAMLLVFVVAGGECCAPVVCFFFFFLLSSFYFVTLAFIYCTQRIVFLCRMSDCVCSCTKLFLIASCLVLCARISKKKRARPYKN